jgi:hypothetical protein
MIIFFQKINDNNNRCDNYFRIFHKKLVFLFEKKSSLMSLCFPRVTINFYFAFFYDKSFSEPLKHHLNISLSSVLYSH